MRHFTTITPGKLHSSGAPGPRAQGQTGMVLIVSLIMLMLLTLLAITATRTSVLEEMMAGNHKQATQALFAAEEGVSKAIDELMSLTINDTGSETDVNWTASGTVTDTGYSAAYSVDHRLVAGAVAATDDGRPYYLIDSTGTSATATRNLEVVLALEYASIWKAGITGCDGVEANSNMVSNSYSSSGQPTSNDQGDLATTNAGADMNFGGNVDVNGDLRSTDTINLDSNDIVRGDALANGTISLSGSAAVNGDARSSSTVSGGGGVGGTVYENVTPNVVPTESCDPLDIDSVMTDAGSIQSSNDNGELSGYFTNPDYWIGNTDTDTLGVSGQAKAYSLADFTMDSDAVVTIQGDVRLYVSGNFTMLGNSGVTLAAGATLTVYVEGTIFTDSNSTVNTGGIPGNMSFYSDATSSSSSDYLVRLDSNAGFNGTVYAPRAAIEINSNSTLKGAVRGSYVWLDSSPTFTYDEDLDTGSGGPPSDYALVYWTEKYTDTGATTTTAATTTTTNTSGTTTTTAATSTTSTTAAATTTTTATTTVATTTVAPTTVATTTTTLPPPPSEADIAESITLDSGDKQLQITLSNATDADTHQITDVSFTTWPGGNGSVKEIKIDTGSDQKTIYSTEQGSSFTVGSGDWTESATYRDIGGGGSSTLQFQFDAAAGSGNYTIEITFDDGGTKTINGPY